LFVIINDILNILVFWYHFPYVFKGDVKRSSLVPIKIEETVEVIGYHIFDVIPADDSICISEIKGIERFVRHIDHFGPYNARPGELFVHVTTDDVYLGMRKGVFPRWRNNTWDTRINDTSPLDDRIIVLCVKVT
jgi:hypothetical protein